MMDVNRDDFDIMDDMALLDWIESVYKLIAELVPDKEAYLRALDRLDEIVKEVSASHRDDR